ncbi:MAG: hypothetical protein R3D43_12460 [Tepidamorphaceae bacterium]
MRRCAGGQRPSSRPRLLRKAAIIARDLVNRPANILGPDEFAARASELSRLGVEISSDAEEMTKAACALLGVGQGSPARKPHGCHALERCEVRRAPNPLPSSARASCSTPAAFRSSPPPAWRT